MCRSIRSHRDLHGGVRRQPQQRRCLDGRWRSAGDHVRRRGMHGCDGSVPRRVGCLLDTCPAPPPSSTYRPPMAPPTRSGQRHQRGRHRRIRATGPCCQTCTSRRTSSPAQLHRPHLLHAENRRPGVPGLGPTQIELQTVPNGSSVIGALSEASDSAQTFCGGLPCIGQLAVNQLTHTVDGRYVMTVLYDKTIAGGTGTSFTVWFAPSGSTTSSPIAKCPTRAAAAEHRLRQQDHSHSGREPGPQGPGQRARSIFDPAGLALGRRG